MIRNAHVLSAELHGRTLESEDLIDLSTILAREGAMEPAVQVAQIAIKQGEDEGNPFVAGYAAGLGSYAAARGNLDPTLAIELGEHSQDVLPVNQPVGAKRNVLDKAVKLRSSGALGVLFSNLLAAPQRQEVVERAAHLIDSDLPVDAGLKLGAARAVNGKPGTRIARSEFARGISEGWQGLNRTEGSGLLKYAGRELGVSAFALSLIGTQSLGRVATPLRPVQRRVARGLTMRVNLHRLPAGQEVAAQHRA